MATQQWIAFVESAFEGVGILALIIGTGTALVRCFRSIGRQQADANMLHELREDIGQSILLGLEFLVAADIIRSVAIDPTFESVGVLGLIVLVRTFLSWTLEVEIIGIWPWQRAHLQRDSHRPDGA